MRPASEIAERIIKQHFCCNVQCGILVERIAAAIEAERDRAEFLRKLLESEGYKLLFCTHCGSDADAGHFECSKWAGQKLNAAETRVARMEKVVEADTVTREESF